MSNENDWLDAFLDESIPIWKADPVVFCREVLMFEPDDWQISALRDLRDNPKVAVKSGQGVGKTGIEACALLWFLTCYPDARIVATAPTKQQLNDVLWSEVSKWMNKSPLLPMLLKWTKTYIYMFRHFYLSRYIKRISGMLWQKHYYNTLHHYTCVLYIFGV